MAYKTYQWKSTDNPMSVAKRFSLMPDQFLAANQGGYPFSTGQTVRIPNLPSNVPNTPPPPMPGKTNYLDVQLAQWFKGLGLPNLQQLNTAIQSTNQPGRGYYRPQPGARSPVGSVTPPVYPSGMPQAERRFEGAPAPVSAMQTASTMGQQPASYRGGGTRWIGDPMSTEAVRSALSNGQMPTSISPNSAFSLGIDPSLHGYVWDAAQNTFVLQEGGAGGGGGGGGGGGNPYTHKIGKDWYRSLGGGRYQAEAGKAGNRSGGAIRNWKGTLLNGRGGGGGKREGGGGKPRIVGTGLINFNAGAG